MVGSSVNTIHAVPHASRKSMHQMTTHSQQRLWHWCAQQNTYDTLSHHWCSSQYHTLTVKKTKQKNTTHTHTHTHTHTRTKQTRKPPYKMRHSWNTPSSLVFFTVQHTDSKKNTTHTQGQSRPTYKMRYSQNTLSSLMFFTQYHTPAGKAQTRMWRSKKNETQVVGWCSDTDAMMGMWILA